MGTRTGRFAAQGARGGRRAPSHDDRPGDVALVTMFAPAEALAEISSVPEPTEDEIRLCQLALDTWNAAKSPNTVRDRLADIRLLGSWAWQRENPAEALARLCHYGPQGANVIVSAWHESMVRAHLADTTRARRIVSVRGAVRACGRMGLRWTLDVEPPRFQPYGRTSGPSWRNVESVIADLTRREDWRTLALVLLLYDVGLRNQEAATLTVDRIDFSTREILVRRKGYGDSPLAFACSRRCLAALQRTIAARPSEWRTRGPIFTHGFRSPRPITRQAVRMITRAAGLGRPHGLRHSGATRIEEATGDVRLAQAHLGHKNVATTQVYLDTRLRSRQREAVSLLSGETELDNDAKQEAKGTAAPTRKQADESRGDVGKAKGIQARRRGSAAAKRSKQRRKDKARDRRGRG